MSKKTIVYVSMVIAAVVAVTLYFTQFRGQPILWDSIQVSGDKMSGDAHVLRFPGGAVILIDTGFAIYTQHDLLPFLKQQGITHLDKVILTHGHRNHYGGILSLIKNLKVGKVYFNLPQEAPCDAETWSTGCDYKHLLETRKKIVEAGVPLLSVAPGDILYEDNKRGIKLTALYWFDGVNTPVGQTDINGTSIISRLDYGNESVLFSADLDKKIGGYLAQHGKNLKADILTAPHHGVESAAPNAFLERVDPKTAIVSNSVSHWQGPRGDRQRKYFVEHGINVYETGLNGNIHIEISPDSYTVQPAKPST